LISHDSETVPAAYSRFDTISPLALFHACTSQILHILILPKLILLHLYVKMFLKNSDVAKNRKMLIGHWPN